MDEITLDVSKLRKVVGRVMVVSAKRTENLSDDDVMQLRQAFLLTSAIANGESEGLCPGCLTSTI